MPILYWLGQREEETDGSDNRSRDDEDEVEDEEGESRELESVACRDGAHLAIIGD